MAASKEPTETANAAVGGAETPSVPTGDAKPKAKPAGKAKAKPKAKAKAKPAVTKPAGKKPAAKKPAASKPAASKPAATKPAASKPAATEACRDQACGVEAGCDQARGVEAGRDQARGVEAGRDQAGGDQARRLEAGGEQASRVEARRSLTARGGGGARAGREWCGGDAARGLDVDRRGRREEARGGHTEDPREDLVAAQSRVHGPVRRVARAPPCRTRVRAMRPIPASRLGEAHGLFRAIEKRGRLRTDEFVTEFSLEELFPPGLENALGRLRHFISFGRAAGLVKEDRGVVELTEIGRRYVRAGDADKPFEISPQQAEWLRRQLRELHMTDSIYHGLAIGLSLLASCPPGQRVSTMDFGRSMAYLGRAGWDNENTLEIQGERHLLLLQDMEMIDGDHRVTPTGEQVRGELTLPVHMSLDRHRRPAEPGRRGGRARGRRARVGSAGVAAPSAPDLSRSRRRRPSPKRTTTTATRTSAPAPGRRPVRTRRSRRSFREAVLRPSRPARRRCRPATR